MPVVASVASAGGLEAITSGLAPLTVPFGAAILVLLHQAPDHLSRFAEILADRCALPAAHAHHDDPLSAVRILFAPPGRHLLVTNQDRVSLVVSGVFPPNRPSADLLLTSMGIVLGPRASAVVLSGTGHDGATGATVVHEFGGTVLTADRASSHAFSMPEAAIGRDSGVPGGSRSRSDRSTGGPNGCCIIRRPWASRGFHHVRWSVDRGRVGQRPPPTV